MKNDSIKKSEKFSLKEAVSYSGNSIVSKVINKNSSGNITLFAFDSNENLSEHTAPFDAMVQVVEGEARIIIDGKANDLSEGDCIIMPADVPHAVEAISRFKMLLTMVKGEK